MTDPANRSCPRCTFPLRQVQTPNAEIDLCARCHGKFFDAGELGTLHGRAADPSTWLESKLASAQGRSRLHCPAGHGSMESVDLGFDDQVVRVEVCRRCRGLWLDANEDQHVLAIIKAADADKTARLAAESDAGGVKTYLFQLFTGLPREVYNPVRQRPWLVYTFLACLIGVFIWQLNGPVERTISLSLIPARLWAGQQVWGLLTSALLHGSWLHLLGNLYFLWVFGDNIEDTLGRSGFLLIFFGAVLAGDLAHAGVYAADVTPCLGASGGIAGLLGAYLVLFPRVKVWIVLFFIRFKLSVYWYLGFWIVLQIAMFNMGGTGTAWLAHIGGFFAGAGLALLFRKRLRAAPRLLGKA